MSANRPSMRSSAGPTFRKAQNASTLAFTRQVLNLICLPCNKGIGLRDRTVDRECLWTNGWHCRGGDLFHSTVGQCVQHKLNSIADPQFVVDPHERLLDRIFFDAQLLRDLSVASPISHQANDVLLSCSQKTRSLGVDDPCRRCRTDGFDDVPYLFRIHPELPLMHCCNAPAKSSERLMGPVKQSTCSRAHGIDDELAIAKVQQKNETDLGMACMQDTERIQQSLVIKGTVAQKHNIN